MSLIGRIDVDLSEGEDVEIRTPIGAAAGQRKAEGACPSATGNWSGPNEVRPMTSMGQEQLTPSR